MLVNCSRLILSWTRMATTRGWRSRRRQRASRHLPGLPPTNGRAGIARAAMVTLAASLRSGTQGPLQYLVAHDLEIPGRGIFKLICRHQSLRRQRIPSRYIALSRRYARSAVQLRRRGGPLGLGVFFRGGEYEEHNQGGDACASERRQCWASPARGARWRPGGTPGRLCSRLGRGLLIGPRELVTPPWARRTDRVPDVPPPPKSCRKSGMVIFSSPADQRGGLRQTERNRRLDGIDQNRDQNSTFKGLAGLRPHPSLANGCSTPPGPVIGAFGADDSTRGMSNSSDQPPGWVKPYCSTTGVWLSKAFCSVVCVAWSDIERAQAKPRRAATEEQPREPWGPRAEKASPPHRDAAARRDDQRDGRRARLAAAAPATAPLPGAKKKRGLQIHLHKHAGGERIYRLAAPADAADHRSTCCKKFGGSAD